MATTFHLQKLLNHPSMTFALRLNSERTGTYVGVIVSLSSVASIMAHATSQIGSNAMNIQSAKSSLMTQQLTRRILFHVLQPYREGAVSHFRRSTRYAPPQISAKTGMLALAIANRMNVALRIPVRVRAT